MRAAPLSTPPPRPSLVSSATCSRTTTADSSATLVTKMATPSASTAPTVSSISTSHALLSPRNCTTNPTSTLSPSHPRLSSLALRVYRAIYVMYAENISIDRLSVDVPLRRLRLWRSRELLHIQNSATGRGEQQPAAGHESRAAAPKS
ncbi:hypothetical protein C4D60_Mb05t06280 [Musa balbisiana]|uniref:Uncharacterized protein n=1 Tax=Musa balbisiana TaxID=52838 RepID=A0A4S8JU35_MUSBA|nr:hypothetical protein C4D60_Mb05t06280 [Musa balbisiana]